MYLYPNGTKHPHHYANCKTCGQESLMADSAGSAPRIGPGTVDKE